MYIGKNTRTDNYFGSSIRDTDKFLNSICNYKNICPSIDQFDRSFEKGRYIRIGISSRFGEHCNFVECKRICIWLNPISDLEDKFAPYILLECMCKILDPIVDLSTIF